MRVTVVFAVNRCSFVLLRLDLAVHYVSEDCLVFLCFGCALCSFTLLRKFLILVFTMHLLGTLSAQLLCALHVRYFSFIFHVLPFSRMV